MRAWGELDDYVDDMVARRRRSLTDDLLSDLIRAEHDGDRLDAAELRMLAGGLLLAGTDTTRNQVAASVQVLCEHPDQWELLTRQSRAGHARGGRDHASLPDRRRDAARRSRRRRDSTATSSPPDPMVLVNTFAANRDPTVYDDPDRVDITREGAPAILKFGGGVHYCLGANLARREIAEALNVLTGRPRNPRIAGPVPWKPIVSLSGPKNLPIEFDQRGGSQRRPAGMAAAATVIEWGFAHHLGRTRRRRARAYRRQRHGLGAMRDCFEKAAEGMYMSGWTRGSLFAALKAAGVAPILGWVLVLSAGPALADPDPAPGDPGVVAATRRGQDPTPFTGHGAFRAAEARSCQRVDGGCGPADHHQLPGARR